MINSDIYAIYEAFLKYNQSPRIIGGQKYIIGDDAAKKSLRTLYCLAGLDLFVWAELIRDYGVFK